MSEREKRLVFCLVNWAIVRGRQGRAASVAPWIGLPAVDAVALEELRHLPASLAQALLVAPDLAERQAEHVVLAQLLGQAE